MVVLLENVQLKKSYIYIENIHKCMSNKCTANRYFTFNKVDKIGKVSMSQRQFQKPSDV